MTGQALLLQADARRLPLADDSVDLIVTSPPYWALRSYTDAGAPLRGQLGTEPDWRDYLAALVAATAEMARVLKPSGSIFVDLGDKYVAPGGHTDHGASSRLEGRRHLRDQGRPPRADAHAGVRAKSLLLLPERYRIACTDELGLIARAVITWHKPNALPESMNDRVKRAHEDWVHLVKNPRYYAAVDELRIPQATLDQRHEGASGHREGHPSKGRITQRALHPAGGLPDSVWSIPSEPLAIPDHLDVDHYAAFPSEWPRRLILGWSPPGICVECDQGRFPVVARNFRPQPDVTPQRNTDHGALDPSSRWASAPRGSTTATILGYACACTPSTWHPATATTRRRGYSPGPREYNAQGTYGRHQAGEYTRVGAWREYHLAGWTPPPTRPAVVADPFCGTGTTVMVARALGRLGIGIDLSGDYLRLAYWRVFASDHAARALARTNHERQTALDLEGAAG